MFFEFLHLFDVRSLKLVAKIAFFLRFFLILPQISDIMVSLPADFVAETRRIMGDERFNRFLGAFDEEAPVSIRVNPRRQSKGQVLDCGQSPDQATCPSDRQATCPSDRQVPWCSEGYYLEDRPQFTFDPLLHAGCYYVQEASSMFVTHILRNCQLSIVNYQLALDMCAAPGGKSTALRSVLPDDCVLISNEPMGNRAQILLENITKWGAPNCIVTNNYPRDFRKSKLKFDLILCDVPCSGEGMMRKDPGAIAEWSPQNVEKCWQLQREIVADAWECLNPGGLLIYSTCTYNTKENEENIQWILDNYDAEVLDIPVDPSWQITGSLLPGFTHPVYRFIPGITRGEGLFVCALRKQVDSGQLTVDSKKKNNYQLSTINSQLKKLKVLEAEIPKGETSVDVDYTEALKYLRGEAMVLPPDTPKGIVTITYKGQPLGPVKNIGNRANNLYPKPWRIKSTHLPSAPVEIINV
jgi:16S rRNA C967 or C1407 C5-methylase (RsmB/RsmF family)